MANSVLSPEQRKGISIVGGFSHPELTKEIAYSIEAMSPSPLEQKTFPNSELYVRYPESVRGKKVFIVQTHQPGLRDINGVSEFFSINDAITEQALLVQAADTSSANEITAVVPFLGYSRQDRKSQGRESISVMYTLGVLAAMGAHRIVTVDLHSSQTQLGFGGGHRQFDHLTGQPLVLNQVRNEISKYNIEECVVVSPDAGATKLAQTQQEALDVDLIHMAKKRKRGESHEITRDDKVADVDGRVCIIFDDMIDTAGTIATAAHVLNNSGAKAIIVAATHGLFSGEALVRIKDSPIDKVVVTDTVPMDFAKSVLQEKLSIVSIATTIGQAIVEIASEGSVSKLFGDQNHR